ncbi:hypothetical protein PISL3812_01244 [Talaromyces islandicus]|uniref:ORC6 first cyclin-like domain-containing protein n=1 Tax=Talaromyces islandicus TaxID=28573 RepID=A0A0U1LLL8_TALIS|nr:hypothetical protein PISL3812_01244 [Talaromyces islandicus]
MNHRPVEQALATLLPTHANEIPPDLLSLAQSLLAQSRSYATSLKPEEEIARPFACAEIACRRLARPLKLPPLLGHPPCPPRVYKKLYTFLDSSIGGNSKSTGKAGSRTPSQSTTTTPRKENAATTSSKSASAKPLQYNTPSKSTPRRNNLLNDRADGTQSKTSSVKRARFRDDALQSSHIIKDAPEWVMPSVRTVCKTLSTPAPRMSLWSRPPVSRTLPPHMFSGVSSILHFVSSMTDSEFDKLDEEASEFLEILRTPGEEKTDDYKEIIMSLVVAVYFLVLARRRSPAPATENINAESAAAAADDSRKMDKKTFSEMRQTALSSLGLSPTDKRHGEDVDAWIALIMDQKWAKGREWFDNIPLAGQRDDDFVDEHGHGLDDDDQMEASTPKRQRTKLFAQAENREGVLLPGLGTMMQDRVDYLSEDRREDFLEWKADIMKRIARMDKSAGAVGRKASVKGQATVAA